jgi:hypothetical protein
MNERQVMATSSALRPESRFRLSDRSETKSLAGSPTKEKASSKLTLVMARFSLLLEKEGSDRNTACMPTRRRVMGCRWILHAWEIRLLEVS